MRLNWFRNTAQRLLQHPRMVTWVIPALLVLVFALLLFPGQAVHKYDYQVGDVVEKDIKSPGDFIVEDRVATEYHRQQARADVLAVYDLDPALAARISQMVQQVFAHTRQELENQDPPDTTPAISNESAEPEGLKAQLQDDFETRLGVSISHNAFMVLQNNGFSDDLALLVGQSLKNIMDVGVVTNRELLLKESGRGIILRNIETRQETVVRVLVGFYGLDQPHDLMRHIGTPLLDLSDFRLRNSIIELVQHLLQPNITFNRNETQIRSIAAAELVKPVFYKVKTGEMLIREGDRVTAEQLLKLTTLQSLEAHRNMPTGRLGAALLLLVLLLIAYMLLAFLAPRLLNANNLHILFLASLLLLFMLLAGALAAVPRQLGAEIHSVPLQKIYLLVPLASGAMVVALLLSLRMALGFAAVLALVAGLLYEGNFEVCLFFLISGISGAYWVQCCRERIMFMRAGVFLGGLHIILITALILYSNDLAPARFFWGWAFGLGGGLLAGMLTMGLTPLAEWLFGYSSDIKLLELANLDQPLLRRLMLEAPGTYHHAILVSTLVEAAATEIGANPLLARVGAYYHDLGKMKKPLYFIENQKHGQNIHDKLAPSMSRRILIMHVKDGVELAHQHKLGQQIVDIIQQHHGTSLISYFYGKALERKGDQEVNMDDYRYPGPKPQTREAGLVMLADVVEAASRTLDNPTPARLQGLVQTLINKIFTDGQLDNCELTLRDLHSIAKTFNRVLNGIHHHRVEYADKTAAASGNGKAKTERAEKSSDRPAAVAETTGLKRLGLS